jgi:hypothetical protein
MREIHENGCLCTAAHFLVTEEPTLTAFVFAFPPRAGRECIGLGAYFSERAIEITGLWLTPSIG